jgi:Ca2+/Na+ antiporter
MRAAEKTSMARRSEQLTLADVVVSGLMPALLIGLVTSLVFFVLEVIYQGDYLERLQFILFCFIVAAVLISRIAMTMGRGLALMYAAVLAVVTLIAVNRLTEIPITNSLGVFGALVPYLLVALAWWCIDVLTHDCTHTGATEETGLLDFGLLKSIQANRADAASRGDAPEAERKEKPKTWLEQYTADREAERRRHRPGFWLIIFSLAALPLFALGQAAVPAADEARRRYIFWLLTVYVTCGLGLLLTTSFLGLRRYLRQRKLEMPGSLTAAWLGMGVVLIGSLLLLATFLPRPAAEYSVPGMLGFVGSKEHKPDRFAFFSFKGEQQRGEGQQGGAGKGTEQARRGGGGQKDGSGNSNQSGQGQGQGPGGQQRSGGKSQGNQRQGQGQGGQQSGKSQGQQQGQNANDPQNQGGNQQGAQNNDPNQPRNPDASAPKQNGERRQDQAGGQKQDDQQGSGESNSESSSNDRQMQPPQFEPPETSSALATMLKWLFILAIVLAALYFLVRHRHELMAWLSSLLSGWSWARKPVEQVAVAAAVEEPEEWKPPPPFSSFLDPFESPGRFSSNEAIVRYSYAALESWAYEHDLGRRLEETPLEFIRRLAPLRPKLSKSGQRVVELYSLVTYARGKVTARQMEHVRQFWQTLPEATQREPASVE